MIEAIVCGQKLIWGSVQWFILFVSPNSYWVLKNGGCKGCRIDRLKRISVITVLGIWLKFIQGMKAHWLSWRDEWCRSIEIAVAWCRANEATVGGRVKWYGLVKTGRPVLQHHSIVSRDAGHCPRYFGSLSPVLRGQQTKRRCRIEVCVWDPDLMDPSIVITTGPWYGANLGYHIGTPDSFYGNMTALQWAYKILQWILHAVGAAVVNGYQVGDVSSLVHALVEGTAEYANLGAICKAMESHIFDNCWTWRLQIIVQLWPCGRLQYRLGVLRVFTCGEQ